MTSTDTRAPRFHWGMIFLSGLSIILLMIMTHFLFIAAYAYFTVPDKPVAFYEDFAKQTSTAFALILGPIIAFSVGYSIAQKSQFRPFIQALMTCLTYFIINFIIVSISGNGAILSTSGFILVQILVMIGLIGGALTHISNVQREEE